MTGTGQESPLTLLWPVAPELLQSRHPLGSGSRAWEQTANENNGENCLLLTAVSER